MANEFVVVVEHMQGKVAEVTFELIGKARELAGALGGEAVALLVGSGVASLAGQLGGAGRVLVVEDAALEQFIPEAWANAAAAALAGRGIRAVLTGHTSMGMDLAPALAAGLRLPTVTSCRQLGGADGGLVATANLYGGKIDVEVGVTVPAVFTVLAGSFPGDAGRRGGSAVVERVAAAVPGARVRFGRLIAPEAADVDITRSDILVSIGRGIGDQANIELAEELADALGAAVSASRPIIDSGWLPKSRQVGKSGQVVKPKCYLACGISGAPEHLEGMRDSALIIAINTDEGAPIFDVAHFGVTADMLDLLPALSERVKSRSK